MTYITLGIFIIFFAVISFLIYKKRLVRSKVPCERCGKIGDVNHFSASSTETTRDYCKVFKEFYYKEPLNLCFQCTLAQDSFLRNILMLSIGHHNQIKEAGKVWGDQAIEMLALLWIARDNMDDARRILTDDAFAKARPWLEEQSAKK